MKGLYHLGFNKVAAELNDLVCCNSKSATGWTLYEGRRQKAVLLSLTITSSENLVPFDADSVMALFPFLTLAGAIGPLSILDLLLD